MIMSILSKQGAATFEELNYRTGLGSPLLAQKLGKLIGEGKVHKVKLASGTVVLKRVS